MAPLLVTAAIIARENTVLLVKRAKEPFKDAWSFIGGIGAFDECEDPKEAVKIEVQADIGCLFSGEFFRYSFADYGKPATTLFFLGDITGSRREP